MTISIAFKTTSYTISLGDSAISKCSYWFSITKEFYEGMQVVHANWVCGFIKKKSPKKLIN